MTRGEYLVLLRGQLAGRLSGEDLEDILRYYEEYFEEAGPEQEGAVMAELGSPAYLAEKILAGSGQGDLIPAAPGGASSQDASRPTEGRYRYGKEEQPAQGEKLPQWAYVLILVAAALFVGPVLLGLVLGFGLGGALCILIGFDFNFGALGASLSLGGILYHLGGGLAAIAVGIFLLLGAIWLVRGTVWLIRKFRVSFVEGGAAHEAAD